MTRQGLSEELDPLAVLVRGVASYAPFLDGEGELSPDFDGEIETVTARQHVLS